MEQLLPFLQDTDDVVKLACLRTPGQYSTELTLERSHTVMDSHEYLKTHLNRLTIQASVPRMKVSDRDTKSGTSLTTFDSTTRESKVTHLPCFTYEHGEGIPRNLPGHSELIRILMEISRSSKGMEDASESNELSPNNKWLSLYTATTHTPGDRPRRRRFIRVSVCTLCRAKGGKHKKWCVNFVDKSMDNPFKSMKRSKTDISEFFSRPREPTPVLHQPKPKESKRFSLRPTDYPDYTNLHKQVYEEALSASRAKFINNLTKDNVFTLERQLTDPVIFSYMDRIGTRNTTKIKDGMVHVFGSKNVDFSKRYEHSVKRIVDQKTSESMT